MLLKLTCICLIGVVLAQDYQEYQQHRPAPTRIQTGASEPKPTPVPILKQINRHNEDGSYTYGYEGADGSFKIETKLATGEVRGKYGYVDADNKVRVVEYGANKYGFQPSGEGITVAPPTLVDETTDKNGQTIPDYEDEQPQQQQPQKPYIARVPRPQPQPQPRPQRPQPPQQPHFLQFEQQEQQPQYLAPSVARSQIENAAPIDVVYSSRQRAARPDPEYSQQQTFIPTPQVHEHQPSYAPSPIARSFPSAPRPVQQAQPIAYSAPRAAPAPPQQYHAQQQQPQQQQYQVPQQQQQYAASSSQGRSTSVLDQLAKDFALPQGGSPALHDITYSYY